MESMEKQTNLIEKSPGTTLFIFAIPMILGNLFQQFYFIIDSMIVGRYVGEEALASVGGASYAISNVFLAIAIGGGVGSSILVSQFFGRGEFSKVKTAIYTILISFLILGVVFGVVGFFIHPWLLSLMNTPVEVIPDSITYLNVYFVGLPFLFLYNVLSSVFHSMGDSKMPLLFLVISSILNLVLDLVFVLVFHQGVLGVALATLIAQAVAAVISFIVLVHRLRIIKENSCSCLFDKSMIGPMLSVALPSILQQSIIYIGGLLVQSVVNQFGFSVMAGFAAGSKIESISMVPMLALGNAMSTYTAQNMGANMPDRVRKGYQSCYKIVIGFAVVILFVLQLWNVTFVGGFLSTNSSPLAYETGQNYVSFLSFFYVLIGLKAVTDGVLKGSRDMAVFTIANFVNLGIRVFIAFLFADVVGVAAVWYAIPIGWAANYLISFYRYRMGRWRERQLHEFG